MTAEIIPELPPGDLLPAPRCRICAHPQRAEIDSLLEAGYAAQRIREYMTSRGAEMPSRESLRQHKRNHLAPPDDPASVVRIALGQGGRQLRQGKVKMTAASLAAFVRIQREIQAEGQTRASEELAAKSVNVMLTVLRRYLPPDQFFAFKDEVWPGLMELVDGFVMQEPSLAGPAPAASSSA
jgi:hypothetical protein